MTNYDIVKYPVQSNYILFKVIRLNTTETQRISVENILQSFYVATEIYTRTVGVGVGGGGGGVPLPRYGFFCC